MELSVNGQVITGSWAEETERGGYYSGAMYYGSIQMLLDVTGRRISGKWVGFGRDMTVNTDTWSLTFVDAKVDDKAVKQWDKTPGYTANVQAPAGCSAHLTGAIYIGSVTHMIGENSY